MVNPSTAPSGQLADLVALAARQYDAGQLVESEQAYRRILEIRPDLAEAHHNLAKTLERQGKPDEAISHYQRAITIKPGLFQPHFNLAIVFKQHGKLDEAEASYRRAIAIRPEDPDAHNNLGNVLKGQGKFPEAVACFERALSLKSDFPEAHYNRAALKTFVPADPDLAALQRLADAGSGVPAGKRHFIHFALGEAFDDLKEYDRAFEHYIQANALKRKEILYDESAGQSLQENIVRTFDTEVFKRLADVGDPSPLPIFILGMPRSGSTLVEQILASHPAVQAAGELRNLSAVVERSVSSGGRQLSYPQYVSTLGPDDFRRMGQAYLASLPPLPIGKTRLVDKAPGNFWYVGLIRLALPQAKIIHTVRDPVDTCVSCFSKLFSFGHPFSYDLVELGHFYRRYSNLMDHWRSVLPVGSILDVAYEEVVDDLEGQARRLLEFCGLPWDPACLRFHETERPIITASNVQVRQPLYRSAVSRWRRYEKHLGPLLAELARRPGQE